MALQIMAIHVDPKVMNLFVGGGGMYHFASKTHHFGAIASVQNGTVMDSSDHDKLNLRGFFGTTIMKPFAVSSW